MAPKKVVIIGGGFGGIFTYLNLHKLTHKNKLVTFTIISDKNYFLFTPLLLEISSGLLFPEDIIAPIRENTDCCMDEFVLGNVDYINTKNHTVKTNNTHIKYDYLVIASGASINYRNIPGAEKYSIPIKTLEDAISLKNRVIDLFESKEQKGKTYSITTLIVGGGATGVEAGVEISELMDELLPYYTKLKRSFHEINIKILNSSTNFLPGFPQKIKEYILENFGKNIPIDLVLNAQVINVDNEYVYLEDQRNFKYDILVWSAGIKANVIKTDKNLKLSDNGRILTSKYLNVIDHCNIFAIGDVADIDEYSIPQLAQSATDEARVCAQNIYNMITKEALIPFIFHKKGLLLSLGKRNAIAQVGNKFLIKKKAWIIWKLFYLSQVFGKGSKIKIVLNWIINEFSPRDISKI